MIFPALPLPGSSEGLGKSGLDGVSPYLAGLGAENSVEFVKFVINPLLV